MRRGVAIVLGLQAALVAGFGLGLRRGWFPLGVPGEWLWPRLHVEPTPQNVILGLAVVAGHATFAALGFRALSRPGRVGVVREGAWLSALLAASVLVQLALPSGAPEGYGLTKWVSLWMRGSSGYHRVARDAIDDPREFWRRYPEWIARQDALHIGTHPPGLLLWARASLGLMRANPDLARFVDAHLPPSVERGFRTIIGPAAPRAERAAIALTATLTLLACAATVVPLYALARPSLGPGGAWAAAALWPLLPSTILFAPTADTAYPLLSTTAFALAVATGGRRRGGFCAALAGVVLAVGMAFTLAFLAVGLVVGLVLATAPGAGPRRRAALLLAAGIGFLAPTLAAWAYSGADPFVIWWWNAGNHARFYEQYPRTYRTWLLVNPIELAAGLGIPTLVWAALGLADRRGPRVAWATAAVLVALTVTGRNLSEVSRLWLPLMPPLLVAAAAGLRRLSAGARSLAATAVLLGLQTLVIEATLQVVFLFLLWDDGKVPR